MSTQILSKNDYPELYAAIAKAYGPLPMTPAETITETEAGNYLQLCKNAYVDAIKEGRGPMLIAQYRLEIQYWSEFITKNWPGNENPKQWNLPDATSTLERPSQREDGPGQIN